MFYNNCTVMVAITVSLQEGYSPYFQRACYARLHGVSIQSDVGDVAVVLKALVRSAAVGEVRHYIVSAMFSTLHIMVNISCLHTLKSNVLADLPEVPKSQLESRSLELLLYKSLLTMSEVLGRTLLQSLSTQIVHIDKNRNVVA